MLVTRPVYLAPGGYFAATPSHGSASSCFMPRLMRCVSALKRMTCTRTCWPICSASAGMVDAAPGDVGHVQQAVHAAQIHERAVIGDVLHHAVQDHAFLEALDQLAALLGARLFQHGAAADDDVAAGAVHLEDLERLRHAHQRADIANRADVHLAARQERHRAAEIDGEAALDPAVDGAVDADLRSNAFSRLVQASSRRAFSRDSTMAPSRSS